MSSTSSAFGEESYPRKRVRKGTHSCLECKRRKTRCRFSSKNRTICEGCLGRGSACVAQGIPRDNFVPTKESNVDERIGRVELLLEKLLQRVDHGGSQSYDRQRVSTSVSDDLDVLTPSSTMSVQHDNAPVLSLLDNTIFGRRACRSNNADNDAYANSSRPASENPFRSPSSSSKVENLRQSLLSLLPPQHAVESISTACDGWWHLIRPYFILSPADSPTLAQTLSLDSLATSHPTVIGKALIGLAISLQQLPNDFDHSCLQLSSPTSHLLDRITATVSLVTSDDELVGTLEGFECLSLQGLVYLNASKPRRSWLCFRRALSIAQLIGIQREPTSSTEQHEIELIKRKKAMWWDVIEKDRYVSVLLGLPYGIGDEQSGLTIDNDKSHGYSDERMYMKSLAVITGHVIDRNRSSATLAFATTQTIDEKLEILAKHMPGTWWDLPVTIPDKRTLEAGTCYDRLSAQIWHFQLEALLHLPFMLRSTTEHRYEYSRARCLRASREMIKRFAFLRGDLCSFYFYRIQDFQAFMSAVTLILNLLGPNAYAEDHEQRLQSISDWNLVDTVIQLMENSTNECGGLANTKGAKILKTLRDISLNPNSRDGIHKLTIPYFGTVSIERERNRQSSEQQTAQQFSPPYNILIESQDYMLPESSQVALQAPQVDTGELPIVSFTSTFYPLTNVDIDQQPGYWFLQYSDDNQLQTIIESLDQDWNF